MTTNRAGRRRRHKAHKLRTGVRHDREQMRKLLEGMLAALLRIDVLDAERQRREPLTMAVLGVTPPSEVAP